MLDPTIHLLEILQQYIQKFIKILNMKELQFELEDKKRNIICIIMMEM